MLIATLKEIGVENLASEGFQSYPADRKQALEILFEERGTTQKFKSNLRNDTRRVPQGSVLGPILFVFTSDIPKIMQIFGSVIICTDDTTLINANRISNDL